MTLRDSPVRQPRIAILAYGSLLDEPGPELAALTTGREPFTTPFPVEYGRASERWNGGPVLVPHPQGGPVEGALLLLAAGVELGQAVEVLRAREGAPDARGIVEVATERPLTVLAASLPRNLPLPDMEPARLAERAARSVAGGPRNGVAYLRRAMASGVRTPRTAAYARALLEMSGAATLEVAERRLLALRPSGETRGTNGLG
jgi:hypothetical protein